MTLAWNLLGLALLLLTLPLTLELLVLSIAASFPPRNPRRRNPHEFRLAVIVPAHNEETLIGACVRSLLADRETQVEVFVVAHNCTDRTASLAAEAGARVLPLAGPGGKGLALDHGFRHALSFGADAVLVIDADSVVSANLLAEVAASIRAGAEAVQTRYEVANADTNFRTRLAALAFAGMNVVRPRGRSRLGLSCGIFGNGFALSAQTLARVPYTANSLVEDLEYHLRLVNAGITVEFLNHATVFGEMPEKSPAAATQRARWEGGRKLMRREWTLPLLKSILRGRRRLIEPLLDLLAQPLATQAALLVLAAVVPVPWLRFYAFVSLSAVALYIAVAASLSPVPADALRALAAAPGYMLWKLLMIPRTGLAARKDAAWVRTQRNAEGDKLPQSK
jgi:GTP:adenosylcobinamide-phosphate guanylyltransferase